MTHHLAQFNIAKLVAPLDDPRIADFVNNLHRINKLGDESPGFVWRHQDEYGVSTSERPYDDDRIIINMTVWEDVESMRNYVYKSEHVDFLKRRREWFEKLGDVYQVLWWIPEGHIPTLSEGMKRLEWLRSEGPTDRAFSHQHFYDRPD